MDTYTVERQYPPADLSWNPVQTGLALAQAGAIVSRRNDLDSPHRIIRERDGALVERRYDGWAISTPNGCEILARLPTTVTTASDTL